MINRLLEQLDKPRRHLTFLVGLLALVFVLSMVVAWRANEAAHDRARIARSTLDETADMAVKDWSFIYGSFVGTSLEDLATYLSNPALSIDSLRKIVRTEAICVTCDSTNAVSSVFLYEAATGLVETRGESAEVWAAEAVTAQVLDRVATRFHANVHGGLYFVEGDAGVAAVLALLTLKDGKPLRITGVVLHEATALAMIEFAFSKARFLQSALAPGNDETLFARSARVGSTELIQGGSSSAWHHEVVGKPVYGLHLSVGPAPSAEGVMQFGADPLAERLTIILLMLVIGALLLMAVLQVRRDAELSRLRADFVSGVSHELRTPLAQIRMFTETLLLGRVRSDVERRRSLEIIDQEARRLAHLVENVLLFSKTEGGRRARVMPEPTHFAEEVRNAVESFTLLSRNRDVEVRTELQENITVAVDRMALRQILVNLVDNALKYGPAGQRITVGAALFDDVARLWVDDEGAGIPPAERAHVFESFYRMSRDVESRVTGSGIGLAVVRELARLHGGDAWAEAAPGRGARIVVQFPDAYLRSDQTGDFAAAS